MRIDLPSPSPSSSSSESWMHTWLDTLAHERKLSTHTLRSYRHALLMLVALAQDRSLESLTPNDIRLGVKQARLEGLTPRSIAHRLSVWRSFYRWLAKHTTLACNPVAAIRAPRSTKLLPKTLSLEDAHQLMEAQKRAILDQQDRTALRDRAILELFYSSGLRLAELIGLDIGYSHTPSHRSLGWLDLLQAQVHVTGKGNRQRIVPVGQKARVALQAWLEDRPTWIRDDPYPLFLSVRGQRMAPGVIRQCIKKRAIQAGLPTHVHPHVLRHSFASHILQSSGDLRAVQDLLGHASIAATQIYTSLDFQHLARIYDKAHPRSKKRT